MIVGLLLSGLLAATRCEPTPGWPGEGFTHEDCPQVYRIHGTAPVDRGLNLVVMSDAFTEEELDEFRCAAGLMVEKLVAIPPFHEFSDSINVFRIDLASTSSGVEFPDDCGGRHCKPPGVSWPDRECQCRGLAERTGLASPLRGRPERPGRAECLQLDLDVHGCPPTARECQVMWPEGEGLRKLWRLAACAPAFDVVLVIANSGAWAGGGTDELHPPLAVATLVEIGGWTHRSRLLAHELGHALGLLDEYSASTAFGGDGADNPAYHSGRNLVRAEPGKLPIDVPWEHLCTSGVAGLERYAAGACFSVCSCEGCDLPDLGDQPVTGLFEGGFYRECEYFRPSQSCKMQNVEDPFCPVCAAYLRGVFEAIGMQPNADGPGPTDIPEPTCR